MLNGATCAPGSDGGAVLGGWDPELDAIVAPILPCLGGLGGDSGGLSLTIRTSAGGAAKNDAAVSLDGKGGCMYVCHAQKIAKLFFVTASERASERASVRSTQFPFK